MELEDLKETLTFLTNVKKNNYFDNDSQKIEYLYNEIKKTEIILPSIEKLEELQKIEIELEIKYNELNELGTYFTPLYIKIKKKIHDEYVNKLREKNKKKRGIN